MENISLIEVHSLYLKNVFNLYEKICNYFWNNPICSFTRKIVSLTYGQRKNLFELKKILLIQKVFFNANKVLWRQFLHNETMFRNYVL